MASSLSFGLSRLTTAGNRIVRADTSQPILLCGVNRSGLEYSEPDEDGFASAAGMSRYEIRHIVQRWGANIIRVPFNQDWVLNGRRHCSAEDYLRDLDRVIAWAAQYGAYTLLDLQWLDADNPYGANRQFVPTLPNARTAGMWALLARRYREEPAVLFDLFNEPHDRLPEDPHPLIRPDGSRCPHQFRVTISEWQIWARHLIDAIRAEHPDALIWVAGTNWAYDLRGHPLDRSDIVYSTHIYRNKGDDWDGAFGDLSYTVPVFAGEWGGTDADVGWGRRLARYMMDRGMGWTAWSWSDDPYVVTRYAPTRFGDLIRRAGSG
ncbi:MAG: cellulase family glycosylhydrolase [Bryobacterales bacterium]|nr:cellulase family glycosylhydrolase [Bryobacterales bacterium]